MLSHSLELGLFLLRLVHIDVPGDDFRKRSPRMVIHVNMITIVTLWVIPEPDCPVAWDAPTGIRMPDTIK